MAFEPGRKGWEMRPTSEESMGRCGQTQGVEMEYVERGGRGGGGEGRKMNMHLGWKSR